MASIKEDISTNDDRIARALNSSGYVADFSPASLWEIDRFFTDHSLAGVAKPGGLLSEDLGQRVFAIGSYMGEVIRRGLGGGWVGDEQAPDAEVTVALELTDGTRCWPIQRAMKRFKNGDEDSIGVWGNALGLQVGPRPRLRAVPNLLQRSLKRF